MKKIYISCESSAMEQRWKEQEGARSELLLQIVVLFLNLSFSCWVGMSIYYGKQTQKQSIKLQNYCALQALSLLQIFLTGVEMLKRVEHLEESIAEELSGCMPHNSELKLSECHCVVAANQITYHLILIGAYNLMNQIMVIGVMFWSLIQTNLLGNI